MSVSAPPRMPRQPPSASGGATSAQGSGVIIGEQPIRRPDTRSPQVMTRRAWWLVVLNFVMPGSAQSLTGNRRLGRIGLTATFVLWAAVLLTVIAAFLWPGVLPVLASNGFFLLAVQILSTTDKRLADALQEYRDALKEKVAESNAQLV